MQQKNPRVCPVLVLRFCQQKTPQGLVAVSVNASAGLKMPTTIADLPDDQLEDVILHLRATTLSGYPGLVCVRWHQRCKNLRLRPVPMLAVTLAKSNKVALLDIDGSVLHEWPAIPVRKRKQRIGSGPSWLARTNWCTGIACGDDGSLFVSQYRVHGLLKFSPSMSPLTRSSKPYQYMRTTATAPWPEGIVCARGCVYTVDMNEGGTTSLRRLSPAGALLEKVDIELEWDSLWGMCLMPDGDGLFIAAHVGSEDVPSDQPTENNTGRILAVRFKKPAADERSGAFHRNGYRDTDPVVIKPLVNDQLWTPPHFAPMPALNRPSDLVCCTHGCLFVSSFCGHAHGRERVIYKLAVRNRARYETWAYLLCRIELPDGYVPEGLTCPPMDASQGAGHRQDLLYVTSHLRDEPIDGDGAIFSFPCGCNPPGEPYEDGTYDPPGDARGAPVAVPPVTKLTSTNLAGPHYITHVSGGASR